MSVWSVSSQAGHGHLRQWRRGCLSASAAVMRLREQLTAGKRQPETCRRTSMVPGVSYSSRRDVQQRYRDSQARLAVSSATAVVRPWSSWVSVLAPVVGTPYLIIYKVPLGTYGGVQQGLYGRCTVRIESAAGPYLGPAASLGPGPGNSARPY